VVLIRDKSPSALARETTKRGERVFVEMDSNDCLDCAQVLEILRGWWAVLIDGHEVESEGESGRRRIRWGVSLTSLPIPDRGRDDLYPVREVWAREDLAPASCRVIGCEMQPSQPCALNGLSRRWGVRTYL